MLGYKRLGIDRLSPVMRLAKVWAMLCYGLLIAWLFWPSLFASAKADEPGQTATAAGAEVAADTKGKANKRFMARVPSGITVELLGVCENPSKDKPLWRPDGSLLDKRPYESTQVKASSFSLLGKPLIAREFAILVRNFPPDGANMQYDVGSSTKETNDLFSQFMNKGVEGLHSIATNLPDQPTVTVRCGATEPWQTIGESTQFSSANKPNVATEFSEAVEKAEGISLSVTHNIINKEIRIVAIGLNGKVFPASTSRSVSINQRKRIISTFSNLSLKDTRCFRLQKRDYEWVEFRNVSLRLGQETDVQIVLPEKTKAETHK